MTVGGCANFCTVQNSFKLFGLEYGAECYCDDDIQPGGGFPIYDIAQCNMACPGDSSETCGGYNAMYIYQALPAPPDLPPGLINNYTYAPVGCYAEPTDGSRALGDFVFANSQVSMKTCADICGYANYPWFGLEYGNECWCASSLSSKATPVDSSQCSFPCAGNSHDTCGGSSRINVYQGTLVNAVSLAPRIVPLAYRIYKPEPRLLAQKVPVPATRTDIEDLEGL
ncbi:unnamed protein product [Discula destructiva]